MSRTILVVLSEYGYWGEELLGPAYPVRDRVLVDPEPSRRPHEARLLVEEDLQCGRQAAARVGVIHQRADLIVHEPLGLVEIVGQQRIERDGAEAHASHRWPLR